MGEKRGTRIRRFKTDRETKPEGGKETKRPEERERKRER
jgi:hypothetical protein